MSIELLLRHIQSYERVCSLSAPFIHFLISLLCYTSNGHIIDEPTRGHSGKSMCCEVQLEPPYHFS